MSIMRGRGAARSRGSGLGRLDLDAREEALHLAELAGLRFAWEVVGAARSNAIAVATGTALIGLGSGQTSRVDAVDVAEANRFFAALSEGGTVTQELIPTFFSEAFGMCVDRFGTPWMVVGPQPAPAA